MTKHFRATTYQTRPRAAFTTQVLRAGVPDEVVKLITGHTLTETVLKHYVKLDEDTVFAKMECVMLSC